MTTDAELVRELRAWVTPNANGMFSVHTMKAELDLISRAAVALEAKLVAEREALADALRRAEFHRAAKLTPWARLLPGYATIFLERADRLIESGAVRHLHVPTREELARTIHAKAWPYDDHPQNSDFIVDPDERVGGDQVAGGGAGCPVCFSVADAVLRLMGGRDG